MRNYFAERRLEADVWNGTDRAFNTDVFSEVQVIGATSQHGCSTVRERAFTAVDVWFVDRAPSAHKER